MKNTNTKKNLSITQQAILRFKKNRRGLISLWIISFLFIISMFAEVISNDKPLIINYNNSYYFPLFKTYSETTFGGDFESEANYNDEYIKEKLTKNGNWVIYPPNPYSFNTINYNTRHPNPAPPNMDNLLGTDDRGRDVLARLIYGFRLSLLFGVVLSVIGTIIGIILGAIQGYFGGKIDLVMQRIIEVYGSMPELYLLIIFASIFQPSIWLLLILLSMFGWMGLADYVRAEFLKARNLDYVEAARALGVGNVKIMWRHLLPNSLTPVITFLPFRLSASILALTSLDYLGLGVPPSTPSLGELLSQGKENIDAWWLSLTTFTVLVGTLILLIFIGEALRSAFDTRNN
ncbi:MAG: ABC transporter permease [Gammaproteobacteria bacterium]|nr:MAG: ABC transporter permease [Gammaproteobacteria bacterium]